MLRRIRSHRPLGLALVKRYAMKVLTHGRPVALVALTVAALAAFAVAPTAMAAPPTQEIHPAPEDRLINDQCTFPVLGHIEGREIQTTFTDRADNPIRLLAVFPGNTLTLTNLDTGKSITVGATGTFQLRVEPDGSGSGMVTGQGAWPDGNPVTGEPGIWYQSGRVSATFDADGNTSIKSTGILVDLCVRLGS
jgi:hypothetical protein